jgi:hypothetical protein
LDEGEKIGTAISGLSGTFVAHIEPAREDHKVKTIDGITNLFYFEWPVTGDYSGYIQAQCLPYIGECLRFSPSEILKNTTPINKPRPLISSHSVPDNPWNVSLSHAQGKNKYIDAYICI